MSRRWNHVATTVPAPLGTSMTSHGNVFLLPENDKNLEMPSFELGNNIGSMELMAVPKRKWKLGGKKCPCPCKKCRNRYWLTYKDVEHHLVSNGIEKSYCVWTLHGEDLSNIAVHPPVVANIGETTIGDVAIEMEDTEEKTIGEVGIGMGNFVDSSFGLHERVVGDGSLGPEFDEPYVPEPDLGKRYYEYKKKATEKLLGDYGVKTVRNNGNVRNGGAASISAAATAIDHTRFPRRRERLTLSFSDLSENSKKRRWRRRGVQESICFSIVSLDLVHSCPPLLKALGAPFSAQPR
ncbi:hypothetical protein IFM89_029015 [Coptis chinensis]|uniref:Transposase-associated domain-containing protein n=1 Tax=Coptis chinensis TaxID=261450 RepID=A0A835M749_9MAGN|nr:hypothetical protein IFM89_029015 [Coptis chinensis]